MKMTHLTFERGPDLDMSEEFNRVRIRTKEKQLNKVNAELKVLLENFQKHRDNTERLAQLTILVFESQRKYEMGKKAKPLIEVDDVINCPAKLAEEYSITFNNENGKLFIANEAEGSEVIIQAIAYNMHPEKDKLPGLAIDRTNPEPGTDAWLTGIFYFENLPVDLMEKIQSKSTVPELPKKEKSEEKPDMGRGAESVRQPVKPKEKDYDSLEDYDKDHQTTDAQDPYGLRKVNPKTLKAPAGLSRSGRKDWWAKLRTVYPEAFDQGLNWIGFGTSDKTDEKIDIGKEYDSTVKPAPALGLLTHTGAGNLITSIIDARVTKDTFFLGRYFAQKNGFVIVSTPAMDGQEKISAMLFFEKERTANFVLSGLLKSPTWEHKLEGCSIFEISKLSSSVRNDRERRVYYITNAVTALQALGTQKLPAQEVEYSEIKD